MRTVLLAIAVGVVATANTVALTLVALNRRGEPTNLIELTEREAPIRHSDPESGSVFLRITFDTLALEPEWLDTTKLASLGFDMSVPLDAATAERHYRGMRQRQAFVALEYEGESWNRWLADLERRIASMSGEDRVQLSGRRERHTRLFAIDSDVDPQALRARYSDARRYLIVPCSVGVSFWQEERDGGRRNRVYGRILRLSVNSINVPRQFLPMFRSLEQPAGPFGGPPRYRVTLRYGSRYEPEVTDVHLTGAR